MVSFAYVLRLTRSSVSEVMEADLSLIHISEPTLIPVVTFIGTDLAGLMGGAIVTEGIFNVPGIGGLVYHAVMLGEAPTVVSIVTLLVLIYMVANLLIALLYAALDPRIRYA